MKKKKKLSTTKLIANTLNKLGIPYSLTQSGESEDDKKVRELIYEANKKNKNGFL